MSEPRSLVLLMGRDDVAGVGRAAIDVAARLADDDVVAVTVAGECKPLLRTARARSLATVDLSESSESARSRWLDRAVHSSHLVHAIGAAAAAPVAQVASASMAPLVVTFDGRHVGPPLAAKSRVGRRAARRPSAIRWLAHGRLATERLVRDGTAHADEVMTLPLLPMLALSSSTRWSTARAAARRGLSLAPGTRVIVGAGPGDSSALRGLDAALAEVTGPVVGFWINTRPYQHLIRRRLARVAVLEAEDAQELLPAMDVLVSGGTTVGCVHPAVDAALAGVPVVASPGDLAAEVVQHSVNGYVCAASDLPAVLDAALAMAAAGSVRRFAAATHTAALTADEVTMRCYAAVLERPLVHPVLIGRRASR